MFIRVKKSGGRQYLQVVESRWEDGKSKQRVIATLGRLEKLQANGEVDGLMRSLARFADKVRIADDYAAGRLRVNQVKRIGPALIFERLWKETGIRAAIETALTGRRFDFPVERAIFATALHRLFETGSDRQAERWKENQFIDGAADLKLHHLYRAGDWLGEARLEVERELFKQRHDLFSKADMFFFDTTSTYFEGAGGESLGQYGHSKDHRPDRLQMIVGAVMDSTGRPISAPMWPGNRTDVTTLLPVVDDMRERFGIQRMSIVADRGMISADTIAELEARDPPVGYILGARMRSTKEVREQVLGRGGRYKEVKPNLQVKEVMVDGRRYIVCRNPDEAVRDAAVRQALIDKLTSQLSEGKGGELIGNSGYRKFLRTQRQGINIDWARVKADERCDGKYVLRTNLDLPTAEVALRYKELWRVERIFRNVKTLLTTRPIYHHHDATIRGHVFVSFLALILLHELDARLEARGLEAEWADIRRDLDVLEEVEVSDGRDSYLLRTPLKPGASAAFRAVGVAIPPSVRSVRDGRDSLAAQASNDAASR